MSSKLAPALILGRRRVRLAFVRKEDLLQVALLGRAVARILAGDLVVGRLAVGVADVGGIGERQRVERDDVDRPVFGRAVARLAVVEEGLQRLLRRRSDRAGGGSGQDEIVDRARLVPDIRFGLRFGLRRGDSGRQRRDDELPERGLAQIRNEHALVHVVVAQRLGEELRVEDARLVAEIRVRLDHGAQRLVGHVEAELPPLLVDRRFAEQPLQDLAVEADGARLLVGERLAQSALILLDGSLIGGSVLLIRYLCAPDAGDGRGGEAAQHVADAPDDEADDDEPHDDGHDRLADDSLSRLAHGFEH